MKKIALSMLVFLSCFSYANEEVKYKPIFQSGLNWYVYLEDAYSNQALQNIAVDICMELKKKSPPRCVVHYWTDEQKAPKSEQDLIEKQKSEAEANKYATLFAPNRYKAAKQVYITMCSEKESNNCSKY